MVGPAAKSPGSVVLIISPGAVMDTIRSVDANLATSVCLFGLSGLLASSGGGDAPAEGSTPSTASAFAAKVAAGGKRGGSLSPLNGQHFDDDDDEDQLFFSGAEGWCGRVGGGGCICGRGTPV